MANLAFWAFAVVYGIFSHQVIKKIRESKDQYVSKVFDPLKNQGFHYPTDFQDLPHRFSVALS